MAASSSDLITGTTSSSRPEPTTLTVQKAVGASSITCDALVGWETETGVHFAIYRKDAQGKKIDGSQTDWEGVVSGTTINGLVIKAGIDTIYPIGSIVECMPTAAWADGLAQALLVSHNADGTIKPGVVAAAQLATAAVEEAKIKANAVTFAKLAADIFGGQLQTYTPTCNAISGVTITTAEGSYINLGGIKVAFGRVGYVYPSSSGNDGHFTFSFPASFFNEVKACIPAIESEGNSAFQGAHGDGYLLTDGKPTGFSCYLSGGAPNSAGSVVWIAIGI